MKDKFIKTKGIITAPTTKQVYRKAAELWAIAHNKGEQTANDKALDGDVLYSCDCNISSRKRFKDNYSNNKRKTFTNILYRYETLGR